VIDATVAAVRAGDVVILPTDTVYGLCALPERPGAVGRLSKLKERAQDQPIALIASDVGTLLDRLPELDERARTIVHALLPGAYTLVLPNPGRRYRALTGSRPDTIGVRVPVLAGEAREIVARLGAVAATSANLHGGRDPRSVDEIPQQLRAAVAAVVDAGTLPGTASTVVDFSGREPRVLRAGAGDVDRALAAAARPRA